MKVAPLCAIALFACNETVTPTPTEPSRAPSDAPTATPSEAPTAPPAPSVADDAEPLSKNDDSFALSATDAAQVGVGFEVKGLSNQGWTWIKSSASYLRLSGPPGGPLSFEVRRDSDADLARAFEAIAGEGAPSATAAEKVALAGAEREAQTFRTGASLATSDWCLIRIPAKSGKRGLLVAFRSRGREGAAPTCASAMEAPALKPITASFALR